MKVAIDVESKQEASAITAAMKDPVTRAFLDILPEWMSARTDPTDPIRQLMMALRILRLRRLKSADCWWCIRQRFWAN